MKLRLDANKTCLRISIEEFQTLSESGKIQSSFNVADIKLHFTIIKNKTHVNLMTSHLNNFTIQIDPASLEELSMPDHFIQLHEKTDSVIILEIDKKRHAGACIYA